MTACICGDSQIARWWRQVKSQQSLGNERKQMEVKVKCSMTTFMGGSSYFTHVGCIPSSIFNFVSVHKYFASTAHSIAVACPLIQEHMIKCAPAFIPMGLDMPSVGLNFHSIMSLNLRMKFDKMGVACCSDKWC